jgi:hypothetical protein
MICSSVDGLTRTLTFLKRNGTRYAMSSTTHTELTRSISRGSNGGRQWDTETRRVVAWLESAEGTAWSREHFHRVTALMEIKSDKRQRTDAFLWYARS